MKRFVIIILLILISGCATTQRATKEEGKPDETMAAIDESFNPATLDDDEITIKKKESSESASNYDLSTLDYTDTIEDPDKELSGYRVQICAVSDENKAREIQRDAILKFVDQVYLIYDSPYYKVRVGNCVTRFEADLLQRTAVEKGFEDAWVVRTKVKPTKKSDIDTE